MGVYAGIITSIIGTGIKLLGSSGGPSYPSFPKLNKLDVQGTKDFMEQYEKDRMAASISEWQKRFPLLKQGGDYEMADLLRNQQGVLSPGVKQAIKASGLTAPSEGDQYRQSRDLGLSPITLSQRTSAAVTRNIANNPEWTSTISGGTLASMVVNNFQNQQAFTQALGANRTANYVAQQGANANNTAALITGIGGAARIGMTAYQNSQFGNNPFNLGTYYQGQAYSSMPYDNPVATPAPSYSPPSAYSPPASPDLGYSPLMPPGSAMDSVMNPYGNTDLWNMNGSNPSWDTPPSTGAGSGAPANPWNY